MQKFLFKYTQYPVPSLLLIFAKISSCDDFCFQAFFRSFSWLAQAIM